MSNMIPAHTLTPDAPGNPWNMGAPFVPGKVPSTVVNQPVMVNAVAGGAAGHGVLEEDKPGDGKTRTPTPFIRSTAQRMPFLPVAPEQSQEAQAIQALMELQGLESTRAGTGMRSTDPRGSVVQEPVNLEALQNIGINRAGTGVRSTDPRGTSPMASVFNVFNSPGGF